MACRYKLKNGVGKYHSDNLEYVKKEDHESKEIAHKFKKSITKRKSLK